VYNRAAIWYVILEYLRVLAKRGLDLYCTTLGRLRAHPDSGCADIAA